ncbi:MAG: N-acetylneuraminate synthase [Candidatus Omnitrophica bacterium]|nr:N-acetylneuraminate synthase [Candidatus Omnitrophota bacterium]
MAFKNTHPKTLIIAEAGVNHNGSLDRALEMINVAAQLGADIVKFQTFQSAQVVSSKAPKAEYQRVSKQLEGAKEEESLLEMARKLELDYQAHHTMLQRAKEKQIEFLSSPFDIPSLKLLNDDLKLVRLKIASGEITNFPFLMALARSGKNLILSSGASTLGEVEAALGVLAFGLITPENFQPNGAKIELDDFKSAFCSEEGQQALKKKVSLLHCTTEYPARVEDVNLRAMDTMRDAFGLPVGLSDHTVGISVPIAAVARGASIIEKHFTLDKTLPGPDHTASLNPQEFGAMVKGIREIERSLGDGIKRPTKAEIKNIPVIRRSLITVRKISKGEKFTEKNLTTKRPGTGVSAVYYWSAIGRVAARDYQKDEIVDSF